MNTLRRTRPEAPVRIVHLGLGAFSRSHMAWYTNASPDAADWGIAAYAGRSRDLSDRLTTQRGLYTLIERDEGGDRAETIESIVRAHAGDDVSALVSDLTAPELAIVTLTITEIGYRLDANDGPDQSDPLVVRDREELSAVASGQLDPDDAHPETALGRLLLGLEARRRSRGGPIALVSCDNLPDNGGRLRRGLTAWVQADAPLLHRWIERNVSFVSSSVDRITPKISPEEERVLRARYRDAAPVVAEPFRDWVISGDFPAGRPKWEAAGARFVDELEPWEARKLWLLNGAHTLLACLGQLRQHQTVAEAIADPVCRSAVEELWDDAANALPPTIEVNGYRADLIRRFTNPRIEHRLEQIAQDTETKMRLRIAPVAELERAAGREAPGCARAFAAWIHAQNEGLVPSGPSDGISPLRRVSRALAADNSFVTSIERSNFVMSK